MSGRANERPESTREHKTGSRSQFRRIPRKLFSGRLILEVKGAFQVEVFTKLSGMAEELFADAGQRSPLGKLPRNARPLARLAGGRSIVRIPVHPEEKSSVTRVAKG